MTISLAWKKPAPRGRIGRVSSAWERFTPYVYIASVQGMKAHPVGAQDRIVENQFENGLGRVDQGSQSGAKSWSQVMSDVKRELQG